MTYARLEDILIRTAEAIAPPERLNVPQAAEKYRKVYNPGHYVGDWDNSIAPYLVEIMEEKTSPHYQGVIFVGPARCGKSDIFFNWLGYTAICDPADMLLIHMTRSTARDWSMGDLQKVIRHNPDLAEKIVPGKQNMNVHDISFIAGQRLLIKWPTITELSGKTVPRVFFMDYDRMPDDIDGEGPAFYLGMKRTQTFGRFGKTIAESSPGHVVEDPKYIPKSPHEAPPTRGILGLYNKGDRRRRYWLCAGCGQPFEADFKHLNYPMSADPVESAEMATLDCPVCEFSHTHDPGPGQPGKHELDYYGKWVKDGQIWVPKEGLLGEAARSNIASFWLKGVAAAFTDWKSLVLKYLAAKAEYEATGDDGPLKTTINVDQGHPYVRPSSSSTRAPQDLKDTAVELPQGVVPVGARFLLGCIDIQKHAFVIQVQAISFDEDELAAGPTVTVIDRWELRKSERRDDDGERYWINPASFLEDWKLLLDEVIRKKYPLDDESGRVMKIKAFACDSGGRDGVTPMAYNFWRWLRDHVEEQHYRDFQLVKGAPKNTAPRVQIVFPDSERKDRRAGARGEVPVMMINSNMIKDNLDGLLGRSELPDQGASLAGRVVFPDWLPDTFYSELTAEVRTTKGWENPKKRRNEAWDLLCYCLALLSSRHVRFETFRKGRIPDWASEWDDNPLVTQANDAASQVKGGVTEASPSDISLEKLGEMLT